jgi:energy-coupling factor transport system ATP-binding protein
VTDEVAFGPENFGHPSDEIHRIVTESLTAVNALHLRDRHTHELSGGEKQRVIIAAMLACQPDYLILDEPSSSLDPKGVIQLREVLTGLKRKGLGVLCIEHQFPAFLPISDRILMISGGKVATRPQSATIPEEISTSTVELTKAISKSEVLRIQMSSFSYGNRKAINQVSAAFHKGELVALMGDNGSGKTTLLGMIAGLLQPDEGEVLLGDNRIKSWKPHEIAGKIGVVFQNPNHQIFERTVWKEHTLGLEILGRDTEDYTVLAEQSLENVGLIELKERNPFSLSHGQKRRLNVSSVSVHNPEIYLFDEPFIGQDSDGRQIITKKMTNHIEDNGTCIVVTHDINFALRVCNRVIFMEKGSILLDGPPKSVIDSLGRMGWSEYSTSEVDPE